LLLREGRFAPVEAVRHGLIDGHVYNREVEDHRCYAVGQIGSLIHNDDGGPIDDVVPDRLPDDAIVVRGGLNTPESIAKATGTHPSGVTGISVESAPGKSIPELAKNLPGNYGRIGTTIVGEVRAAGGDVIPTSGRSPTHATLTGLDPETTSGLLNPPIPNPAKIK
jgi:hypothetical protein